MFLLMFDMSYEMVEGAKKAYDTDGMRIPNKKQSGRQNRTPADSLLCMTHKIGLAMLVPFSQ